MQGPSRTLRHKLVWAALVFGSFEQVWVQLPPIAGHATDDLVPLMSHIVISEFFCEEQLRQEAGGKLKSLAECTVASSLNAQGASTIFCACPVRYSPAIRACGKHSAWQCAVWLLGAEESLGQVEASIYCMCRPKPRLTSAPTEGSRSRLQRWLPTLPA